MTQQLQFYGWDAHNRIKAILPAQIFVPSALSVVDECLTISNASLAEAFDVYPLKKTARYVVQSLCGRKKNTRKDLAVLVSHLHTIRKAIYDRKQKNQKYALILEDDLRFSYDIDFQGLIDSAPPGFGVLQLITSNVYSVQNLWKVFQRHKLLWVERYELESFFLLRFLFFLLS